MEAMQAIENNEKLAILKERNPFCSSSAGDPWEGKYPDLPSVNQHAFEELCRLIRQKAAEPASNFAGLILGEVGSGKTHLLGRVLEYCRQADYPFTFAYIQPLEDPEQTFRYLLREVLVNLCHPIDRQGRATQIHRILEAMLRDSLDSDRSPQARELLQQLQADPGFWDPRFAELEKAAYQRMRTQCYAFPRHFLKVLFQYRDPEKQAAAFQWLKGEGIDVEDGQILGVADRERKSETALEQEARDILNAFGLLMARYDQSLLVCFDRLENLESDEQIHGLGKMVEFLVDVARGMLPVVCCRGTQWNERLSHRLNQHVVTRLETNQMDLKGCTADQALEIIGQRLAFVLGGENGNTLFPFDRNRLYQSLQGRFHSPRRVIMTANQRLRRILYPEQPSRASVSDGKKLSQAFESQYQQILADLDRHQPDRGRLRHGLKLFLQHLSAGSSVSVADLRQFGKSEKYLDLSGTLRIDQEQPVPFIILIDLNAHHSAVGACLRRGIDFLEENPDGRALYLRDGRCPFPPASRWKQANAALEAFKARGGGTLFLDAEAAARLYGLALLHYAVREGNISQPDNGQGMRPVAAEAFDRFVNQAIQGEKYPVFRRLGRVLAHPPESAPAAPAAEKPAPAGPDDDERIVRAAVDRLRPVPMMMLASDKITESLNRDGLRVDQDRILATVGRYRDRFEVIQSKDNVLVMLKKDWLHAQGKRL